jgi:hypothetical protein
MRKILIALAMVAGMLFVSAPAQATDWPGPSSYSQSYMHPDVSRVKFYQYRYNQHQRRVCFKVYVSGQYDFTYCKRWHWSYTYYN